MQPTEINLGHGVTSGDMWKLTYEYGELETNGTVSTSKNTGNIARQTISFSGLGQPFVQSYKYDSLYRLTEAKEVSGTNSNSNWIQTFGYDQYGNRTSTNQFVNGATINTTPAIDPNTNRFTSPVYQFDKNGNLTQDIGQNNQTRTIVFNGDNKQTEVKDANGTTIARYFFDGEGKRVKKKLYDPSAPTVVKEETIFVYSSGKLIAEYSTAPAPPAPTTNYTATDMLGSPRVLTNSLGEVVSRRDFLPFGEEIFPDGANRTANQKYVVDGVRQKFTGYQKDEETGLDFAEARMYDNRFGRFTAVDPLLASGKSANPQSFNRFVYVGNDPVINTDPSGLCTEGGTGKNACPKNYIGPVFSKILDGRTLFNDNDPDGTWKPFTGRHIGIRNSTGVRTVFDSNGWYESPIPTENEAIRALATTASYGVYNESIGIIKGIINSPVFAWNGLTHAAFNYSAARLYFQGSNPFAVPNILSYSNSLQASSGSAGSTGFLAGLGGAVGAFGRASSSLSVVPETQILRFSQTSASKNFSTAGNFGGRSVMDVAGDLQSGVLSPNQVPVNFVQRGSFSLIDNTRSTIALQEAGVPINQWNLVNRTGVTSVENAVTTKLLNNNLPATGTSTVRFNGCVISCP